MKVACISHGSIVALNRRPFDLLRTAHGIDVTVIVPDTWKGDFDPIRFEGPQDGVMALPATRAGNGSLFTLRNLAQTIEALRPDLVLLDEEPWSLVAWQVLRAKTKAPLIFYSKQNIAKRMPPPFSTIRGATYRRAKRAWAVGGTTAEVLHATKFAKPVDVVPHGVEITAFTPGRDEERRAKLGLQGVVVGYAGRLVEEKGIRDLLQATRLLANLAPRDFTLLVAGAGPLESDVRHAAAYDGIRVVGVPAVPHHEAPGLYRLMDIFVLPSRETPRWREQFGRALVEAAATRLPIIAASTGEIPFVMRGLGGGGRLVPPEDPGALASVLRDMIDDAPMREKVGAANLEAARRLYSQEAISDRMAGLLQASHQPPATSYQP